MVQLIDVAFTTGDSRLIKLTLMKMVGLTLLGYVSSMTCQFLASAISQEMAGNIREDLYDKITQFKLDEFQIFSKEALLTRMSLDVNQVQDLVARTIRLAVRAPFLMIGSLFAMFKINYNLGMVLLKTVLFFVLIVSVFMYLSKKYHKNSQELLDKLKNKFTKVNEGMRYVRAFNMQEKELKDLAYLNQNYYTSQRKIGVVSSLSSPLIVLCMNLVLVYLIKLGAIEISSGNMTQGEMLAIINYCTQLVMTLIVFMNLVLIFARGLVSSQRIEEVLSYDLNFTQGNLKLDSTIRSIRFENVGYTSKDNTKILEHLTFSIKNQESLGIVGLSGSGKTTILNLLLRFIEPSFGKIYINDIEISNYDYTDYLSKIAFVTQSPLFINHSLEENVLMGQEKSAQPFLIQAQAKEIISKGLDYEIYDGGINLSGGQKQRVSVARAFSKQAPLFILDEALNGLDRKTMRNIETEILKQSSQKIVVSQNLSFLSKLDKILVLEDKTIQGFGSFDEVKNTEVIKKIEEMAVQI